MKIWNLNMYNESISTKNKILVKEEHDSILFIDIVKIKI